MKLAQYPIPEEMLHEMEQLCEEVLVLEEGYPLVEEAVKAIFSKQIKVSGRLSGALPRDGELNADLVAKVLGLETLEGASVPDLVVNRPPALCQGCGHQDMYKALNEAVDKYSKGGFSPILGVIRWAPCHRTKVFIRVWIWELPLPWQKVRPMQV